MDTDDILNEIAVALKTDIINSLQANGSGSNQTMQQIVITKTDNGIQLQLPSYLLILEKGRGPTSKDPVPGNPPMIQRIQQWCREKGIDDKAAWAIKKKIDKVGYPAKPGIITGPLGDDNINSRLADPLTQLAEAITTQILNAITI
ncbi:MAG: hypothetical protein ACTHNW_17730 [Mucilaginibacter sp.]